MRTFYIIQYRSHDDGMDPVCFSSDRLIRVITEVMLSLSAYNDDDDGAVTLDSTAPDTLCFFDSKTGVTLARVIEVEVKQ